jgi:enoyl-CoA hydratase/carnithine racemase
MSSIAISRRGCARVVTMRRLEKRNAIDPGMRDELIAAIQAMPADGERLLILNAEGTVFSAGNDLAMVSAAAAAGPAALADVLVRDTDLIHALENSSLPTLALVEGPALGFANELIATCDWAIALDSVTFAWPEPKFGITPFGAPSRRIGRAYLWRWLAGPMSSADAQGAGLVDMVVGGQEVDPYVESILDWVAAFPPEQYHAWRAYVIGMRERSPSLAERLPGIWSKR